jgi:anti-sigma factor RsiW
MVIDEGLLRAYVDGELAAAEREAIEEVLAHSPETRADLSRMREDIARTEHYMASLAPAARSVVLPGPALARLQARISGRTTHSSTSKERIGTMISVSIMRRHQTALTALVLVALVAVAFRFASVRVMAGSFLKIFRVQEVKLIPVDLEYLESNDALAALLERLSSEAEVLVEGGQPRQVANLAEAATQVDFALAEIGDLPQGLGEPSKLLVKDRTVSQIYVDRELAQAVFDAAEIEVSLPASLDETPVVLTEPTMLLQQWGTDAEPVLSFTQMKSPEIEYPDDLDLDALGVAGLQLLGMSEAEARALGASIDWTNTLVLPIPKDEGVKFAEVQVSGAKGFLFQHEDDESSALMWQQSGKTYLLAGNFSADEILQIGRSVR